MSRSRAINKKTLNDKLNPEMHSVSQTKNNISGGNNFNDKPVPVRSLIKMLGVKSKVFFFSWRYIIGCNWKSKCYSVQFVMIPNTVPMGVFCRHFSLYISLRTALNSFAWSHIVHSHQGPQPNPHPNLFHSSRVGWGPMKWWQFSCNGEKMGNLLRCYHGLGY